MKSLEIPEDRRFTTGRLEARRRHLVAEAAHDFDHGPAWHARLSRERISRTRVLAFALTLAVVGAFGIVRLVGSGAPTPAAAVEVVRAPLAPGAMWRAASGRVLSKDLVPARHRQATRLRTEILGGTPEQRALLDQILARMPQHVLTRVRLVVEPHDSASGGVTVEATFPSGDSVRGEWESNLLAGAFRDLSARAGLPPVIGLAPASGPVGAQDPAEAARLRATLRAAVAGAGAAVEEVSVYGPEGLAPVIVIRVPSTDAARFLQDGLPGVLGVLGNPWLLYDGTFVEVVDDSGSFVWAASTAQRVSTGSVASRTGLEGCGPIASWGPPPAPCPAR